MQLQAYKIVFSLILWCYNFFDLHPDRFKYAHAVTLGVFVLTSTQDVPFLILETLLFFWVFDSLKLKNEEN